MLRAIAIGCAYMSASALGIVLNCRAVWSIISKGKLSQIFSALYILYLQPLIADIVFELIYLCYLSPSIIIQKYSFQDVLIANPVGWYVSTTIDALQSYCWSVNSLSQVSLALNSMKKIRVFIPGTLSDERVRRMRIPVHYLDNSSDNSFEFIVTVLHRTTFFSMNRAIFFSVIQHLLALAITAAVHFILPCCSIAFSYEDYGYREVAKPGVPNYVFAYVSMPVKVGCATIPLVIYCMILISARTYAKQFKQQSPEWRRRRKKELRLDQACHKMIEEFVYSLRLEHRIGSKPMLRFAAQFASIALVYTFSSFSFNLLMVISRSESDWVKGIPVILGLLNSTSNGVVYLVNENRKGAASTNAYSSSDMDHESNLLRIKKRILTMVAWLRVFAKARQLPALVDGWAPLARSSEVSDERC
ncbi:hypothetical protein PRIPAC_95000 [Pristionchus pacificus]|uniref:7TM_GPCR_Srx domain-containing protein n=1 Tax=Pristionchus pacificus TaxID=54126 RepID=A0A2A6CD99_PRIPA|nr:hypothetical protein PRIPAC_95000 [Pristionchus pacificus]|eukprot:PDM76096.1 hypothetical protein PRIPAC_39700 [Pristionchus pacificus]